MRRTATAAAILALAVPGATAQVRPPLTALVNARVLDVTTGEIADGQTILIVDGTISFVGPAGEADVPPGARQIDVEGNTVLPGLVDAHVHADSSDFPLFLANGVTAVRELNGSAAHLRWRDEIAGGRRAGPRLLVASPLLSGKPLQFRHEVISTPQQGEARVRSLAADGYDLVKVYDDLTRETYLAIARTAHALDLDLTGHIPRSVGLAGVLGQGQSLEHVEKIVIDVLGHGLEDTGRLEQAAVSIGRAGVAVTPTLAVHEVLNSQHEAEFARRFEAPELEYVDQATLSWWRSLGSGGGTPRTVEGELWPVRFLRLQRELARRLSELDVPILAGTDTPNPMMVPGFSLHDELEALVRAGLSPLQALKAATLTPGTRLDFGKPVGRVAAGYAADLLIVSSDPLPALGVLRRPQAVVTNGEWLDREALDSLLAQRRAAVRGS